MRDLRSTLARLTNDTAFTNDFFGRYIDGREVPDYAQLLARAGFLMTRDNSLPVFGASLADDTTSVFVNWSSEDGSAFAAGLASGDLIYAVDGVPVTTRDSLDAIISRRRIGETLQLDVEQRRVRRTIPMKLLGEPRYTITTFEKAGRTVTEEMKRFRQDWLGSQALR